MANSVDPDQTAPIGAVCSGSKLFASILNLSLMLGNYLQQTTSADVIFRCIFFLGTLRGKKEVDFCLVLFYTFQFSHQAGNCRVMAYSPPLATIVVSQPSSSPLFPGFGVKKVGE